MGSPEHRLWDGWRGRGLGAIQTAKMIHIIVSGNIFIAYLQIQFLCSFCILHSSAVEIFCDGINTFFSLFSERLFMQMADLLISDGYYDAGYR